MALITCPQCGKQVSDKASVCPHCGIDVQKALARIREEETQQQEKRKRRILISVVSAWVVVALAVLAYLYYIDALNSIPADYRKQTEGYFISCESAISNGNFEKGSIHLNSLKNRTLTNRQAKRLKETEKAMVEVGLCDLEKKLVSIANNSDTQIDNNVIKHTKEEIATIDAYLLDASQTERLKKSKEQFAELILTAIEKRVGLQDGDRQINYSFEVTNRLSHELQKMELSTAQRTRLEKAMKEAERIRKLEEEKQHKQLLKTIRDEYIRLLSINKLSDDDYGTGYFLYDIDNNGIPEIWIKTGTCEADFMILVYTYDNGIRHLYSDGAGHSSFYQGDGYIIQIYGHMGYATWEKLNYNGSSIIATKIYEEDINGTERDYKDPKEKYITLYSLSNKQPILNAFKTEVSQYLKETQNAITTPKVSKETAQTNNNTKESKTITEDVNIEKNEVETPNKEEFFTIVEEMPSFPGGEQKLMEYVSKSINYPQTARDKGIQGRVFVGFVVEPDGSISDVKLLRGIGGGCDEEAIRVIQSLPKWKPGKQKGKAVRVSYQIPVFFKLPK